MSWVLRSDTCFKISRQFHPKFKWQKPQQSSITSSSVTTVEVTKHEHRLKKSQNSNRNIIPKDETKLIDSLLSHTEKLMIKNFSSLNIIAFSGGVDSSLAAALVHQTFHRHHQAITPSDTNNKGRVMAVLGVSSSLPQRQLELARKVASHIGIELQEVKTTEGTDEEYIANKGQACFVCKNHLYSALKAVSQTALLASESSSSNHSSSSDSTNTEKKKVVLYNGTNADDTQDPTRLGLIAADNFQVQSPLIHITKEEVRRAARHLGLPNWDYAASPCLRSRLALGVEATAQHLQSVSLAEERVKSVLQLSEQMNVRVRMLAGKKAMIELDEKYMTAMGGSAGTTTGTTVIEALLKEAGIEQFLMKLGFTGGMGLRPFKSGSVSVE